MKAYRVLYRAVMVCALLGGLYTGSRFCWLLFLVQGFTLLAALGLDLWTFFSFSYLQKLNTEQGEKGQTVVLHIGIYNDKPFPFTNMKVKVEAPDPEESRVLDINLAPKANCSFDLRLSLPRRGEFQTGMTQLEVQDVFGLLPLRFDLRFLPYYRLKPLLVLPRVQKPAVPVLGAEGISGLGKATEISRDEFAYVRPWQPGDPLSRVHWKSSAKAHALFTRQYEAPAGEACLIFLDRRELSEDLADALCECAATLLYLHLSRGDQVELLGGRETKNPERAFSLSDLTALRQWLAVLKFDRKLSDAEDFREALSCGDYQRVYVLGGKADPELSHLVESLKLPVHYWLAGPLEAGEAGEKAASLYQQELTEFLSRNLVSEP